MNIPQEQENNYGLSETIFDSMRNIWVKKTVCNNMAEVVSSKDFKRIFRRVISDNTNFDKKVLMPIIIKINQGDELDEVEQKELLACISDPIFILQAKQVQNRLKGFAAREAAIFLELYPVSDILKYLQSYISDEIRDLFEAENPGEREVLPDDETNLSHREYDVMLTKTIGDETYELLCLTKGSVYNSSHTKRRCRKRKGDLVFVDEFIYEHIQGVVEYGETADKIISQVRIGDKEIYASLEDIMAGNVQEPIFDQMMFIKEVNDQLVYQAKLNGKRGYVRLGKEAEDKGNLQFGNIKDIEEFHGRYFYTAEIGTTWGYMELGKPVTKEDVKRLANYRDDELSIDNEGNIFYTYNNRNGFGSRFSEKKYTFPPQAKVIVENTDKTGSEYPEESPNSQTFLTPSDSIRKVV